MTNASVPRAAHRRRNAATYAICAAALGVTVEAIATQVDLEIAAGYSDDDAIGAAYVHLADPFGDRSDLRGPRPIDPYLAAGRRHSPGSTRNSDRRLDSALRAIGAGVAWQAQAMPDYIYRLPVLRDRQVAALATKQRITRGAALIELRAERLRELALDDAAWSLYPADTRCGRKKRKKFRDALIARYEGAELSLRDHPHREADVGPEVEA